MLLIKNGRIETMAGMVLPQGDVLCKDGKIECIAPKITLPESAQVQKLDASGCLILPGLIDAHCHVGISEEKKGIEGDDCNENVNPVTPWLRALDAVNMMDAAFADAQKAGITSVMTGPGSANVVGGQFVMLKTHGRCTDEAILQAPAAMKVAFGENPKVNYSGMDQSPVTRMGIAGLLRKTLYEAGIYCAQRQKAGLALEEHLWLSWQEALGYVREGIFTPDFEMEPWTAVFAKRIPLKAHVHRVDDIFTAMRIAREFGLDMTLDHCSEGHLIAEQIAESGFPAIVGPDLSCRSKIEIQYVDFKTAGILHKAGVLTAICTDHPVSLIASLPLCAGLAVKAGLPMQAGLEAITCNAARICKVFDRVGSLEPGKDADIAVFDRNPMEVAARTRYTLINGQIVYRQEDD